MTTIEIYPQWSGFINGTSTDYATARADGSGYTTVEDFIRVGQGFAVADLIQVNRGYLRFDTTVIPASAVINNASLSLKIKSINNLGAAYDVDLYKIDSLDGYYPFSTTNAIDAAYDLLLTGTKDVTIAESTGMTTDTVYTSTDLDTAWIAKGGYTYYGLKSSQDCSTGIPSTNEIVSFYSSYADNTTDRPLLTIDYDVDSPVSYTLNFMWGSTEYSIDNEASRMVKFAIDRGRREIFGDSFNDYDIGELRVELDNHDGRYDPWNTSGELYGNLLPGTKMRFRATYEGTVYTFFTGVLSDISVNGYRNTVTLTCEDGWRNLRDNEVSFTMTSTDTTFSTALTKALSSTSYTYPYSLSLSTSTDIPTYNWADRTSIKAYIENIAYGSLGRAWIDVDGDFNFADIGTTDASVDTLSEDIILKTLFLPMPWDNYYSQIKLNGYELYYGEPESQYWIDYDTNVRIWGKGETTSIFKLRYSNEIPYLIDNPYPAVDVSTDVTLTLYDSTGGVIPSTGNAEVIVNWESVGSTSADLVITNSMATSIYFYGVQYPYDSTDTPPIFNNPYVQTFTSTNTSMPTNEFSVDSSWMTVSPSTETNYELDKTRIEDVGNTLLNYLSTIRPYPIIQLRGRYDKQFGLDLEDKITLTYTTLDISGEYRISAISHESRTSPQDVITTFWLYPVMEKST